MKSRNNLCETIVDDIKKDIISGKLKPGEKILVEFEYSEMYEVSRFTVREAMKMLDSMGLITIKHGIGSFVNQVTPKSFMKPLLPVLMLSDYDIEMLCEARIPIEVQAISLCVDRASGEDIAEMEGIIELMESALQANKYEEYNDLDLQFHLLIAKASKNHIIYEILSTLQDILREQMRRVFMAPLSKERSISRHIQMVEAIKNKDKELTKQIMTLHINDSIEYLIEKNSDKRESGALPHN